MANVKFTDLAQAITLDGTELLAIVQPGNSSGTSKSTTSGAIAALGSPAGLDAEFVLLATSPLLTDARVLTASSNVTLTDAGAGSTVTVDLSTTGVVAGAYTSADVTVDAKGRITAIAAGGAGTVTSVGAGTGITISGTPTVHPVVGITNTGVTAGTYGSATKVAQIQVGATGQITTATELTVTPAVGSITGLGTGVGAALAINVGSAGAPVLFNGAGGTPSSLVLTNATGLPVGSITGAGTGVLTALAVNVGSAGAFVTFNGAGGTPSSVTLTNGTGLPVGGITGFGSGIATWLATPSSANLRAAMTDESGTGVLLFASSAIGTPLSGVLTNCTGYTVANISGAGTGVLTALGVNVGSAGAFVTFNGAGGTPSSLTLTNATGLPVGGGGTGAATFTDGGVMIGNAANALQATSAGTAGFAFNAGGAGVDPTWQNNGIRAHICFDGTGTPTARGTPYNVTSITDNGTGDWTINFTSALPSANYTFGLAIRASGAPIGINQSSTAAPAAGSIRITSFNTITGVAADSDYVSTTCTGG